MKNSGPFKKSVCVTGGTGFIGSNLSLRLVNEGASVSIITDNAVSLDRIDGIKKKVKLYECDITHFDSLLKTVEGIKPELVYHLAANIDVGPGFDVVDPLININVHGTINMLNASVKTGVLEKFIFIGTSDVYGTGNQACSEDSTLNPVSAYGASKAAAEMFVKCLAGQYGIPWTILRPFIIYGPGQYGNMFIPQLIQAAIEGKDFPMTGGKQTRDFLYVDDFVDACIKTGLSKEAAGEVLNIASGKETSLADIAEKVMALLDNPVKILLGAIPYRDNERWSVKADVRKAGRLLHWKPKTDLTEGLKKTIHWFTN